MTPRGKYALQAAGGCLLTLVLAIFLWQGVPFLLEPDGTGDDRSLTGVVKERRVESLSGSTNHSAVTYHLIVSGPSTDGRVKGLVSRVQYDRAAIGDPVALVTVGRRAFLRDDLRWDPRFHRKYKLMGLALFLVGLEAARRLFVLTLFDRFSEKNGKN
jgi:hypothetical protein